MFCEDDLSFLSYSTQDAQPSTIKPPFGLPPAPPSAPPHKAAPPPKPDRASKVSERGQSPSWVDRHWNLLLSGGIAAATTALFVYFRPSVDCQNNTSAQWVQSLRNRRVEYWTTRLSVCSHRSLICWHHTARFACVLCYAHSFARTAHSLPSSWERGFCPF